MEEGKYIVIEGHDGTGKSSQVNLICEKLSQKGIETISFHEPAGTAMSNEIRDILKNGNLDHDTMADILLFSAARSNIWKKLGLVALNEGKWIVASRNYFSTLAYQGYGDGYDRELIKHITSLATDNRYMNPDLAFILKVSEEERLRRIELRGPLEVPDTFESKPKEVQDRIDAGYIEIAHDLNLPIIDADPLKNVVANDIWSYIEPSIIDNRLHL